jgi:hypothetical protein
MSGTLQVSGQNTTSGGSEAFDIEIPMSDVDEVLDLSLISGDNVVNIPAGCNGCWVVPPSTNTGTGAVTLKTKSTNSDAGEARSGYIAWSHSYPTPAPASFIINASGPLAGVKVRFF